MHERGGLARLGRPRGSAALSQIRRRASLDHPDLLRGEECDADGLRRDPLRPGGWPGPVTSRLLAFRLAAVLIGRGGKCGSRRHPHRHGIHRRGCGTPVLEILPPQTDSSGRDPRGTCAAHDCIPAIVLFPGRLTPPASAAKIDRNGSKRESLGQEDPHHPARRRAFAGSVHRRRGAGRGPRRRARLASLGTARGSGVGHRPWSLSASS